MRRKGANPLPSSPRVYSFVRDGHCQIHIWGYRPWLSQDIPHDVLGAAVLSSLKSQDMSIVDFCSSPIDDWHRHAFRGASWIMEFQAKPPMRQGRNNRYRGVALRNAQLAALKAIEDVCGGIQIDTGVTIA